MSAAEQAQGVHQARESHALKLLSQLEARKNRLKQENMALVFPEPEKLAALEARRAAVTDRVAELESAQHDAEARLPDPRGTAPRSHPDAAGSHARARGARGVPEGAAGAAGAPRHRFEAEGLGAGPRPRARRAPLAGDPRGGRLGRRGRSRARRAAQCGEARRRWRAAGAAARCASGQFRGLRRSRRARARHERQSPNLKPLSSVVSSPRTGVACLSQRRARQRLHPPRGRGRHGARARAAARRAAGLQDRPPLQPPGRRVPWPAVGAARRAAAPARDRGPAGPHSRAFRARVPTSSQQPARRSSELTSEAQDDARRVRDELAARAPARPRPRSRVPEARAKLAAGREPARSDPRGARHARGRRRRASASRCRRRSTASQTGRAGRSTRSCSASQALEGGCAPGARGARCRARRHRRRRARRHRSALQRAQLPRQAPQSQGQLALSLAERLAALSANRAERHRRARPAGGRAGARERLQAALTVKTERERVLGGRARGASST